MSSEDRLAEIIQSNPANQHCAECGVPDPEWASVNLGIFLCIECAGAHRSLGRDKSKVKSIQLDKWTDDEIAAMRNIGNGMAEVLYDRRVPFTHKRVSFHTPMGVRAHIMQQKYESGPVVSDPTHPAAAAAALATLSESKPVIPEHAAYKEGHFFKKGKDSNAWQLRWFKLTDEHLIYFVNDEDVPSNPKNVLNLKNIMVTLRSHESFKTQFGLQITYRQKETKGESDEFRNFFLAAQNGNDLVEWLNGIRLNRARLLGLTADTPRDEAKHILTELSQEVVREGYLQKTGPKGPPGWKRRWFALHDDRLLYYKTLFDATAKGNVIISKYCRCGMVPDVIPVGHWCVFF